MIRLGAGRSSAKLRVAAWMILAVVLAVSLAIGASGGSSPRTPTAKAAALDAQLRCPSCEDLSVADSSAPSAVAIRQLVLDDEQAGQSESQIVSYLQSRYPGIVLRPPATGIQGIVWYAPVAGFAVAFAVIVVLFKRRQTESTRIAPDDEDRRLVDEALGAAGSGATP